MLTTRAEEALLFDSERELVDVVPTVRELIDDELLLYYSLLTDARLEWIENALAG